MPFFFESTLVNLPKFRELLVSSTLTSSTSLEEIFVHKIFAIQIIIHENHKIFGPRKFGVLATLSYTV